MTHPHRLQFSLTYADSSLARIIQQSLRQDVGEIDDDRSTTSLERNDSTLYLSIQAADLIALRAAANTWLTLAEVAERSASVVDR